MTTLTIRKVAVGGIWEFADWQIEFDYECNEYDNRCPHAGEMYQRTRTNLINQTSTETHFRVPRVVVATNEGGYNTTGVCLDCILDAVKGLT